jgi:hypothetical protein
VSEDLAGCGPSLRIALEQGARERVARFVELRPSLVRKAPLTRMPGLSLAPGAVLAGKRAADDGPGRIKGERVCGALAWCLNATLTYPFSGCRFCIASSLIRWSCMHTRVSVKDLLGQWT